MKEESANKPRQATLPEALLSFLLLVLIMSIGIIVYKVDPHIPMFVGVIGAALMAFRLGYKWTQIERFMLDGINRALQSIIILCIIGILIGVWIDSGVVPSMIYYGLKILSPKIFFIATILICSITSLATGTSWGTMGTMGLALMGIGYGLGIHPGMTAGAVLSGAYFGDKMSPLSDTTNLAPAMAGTDVITHIKFMMVPTVITYIICLVFYGIMGLRIHTSGAMDMSAINEIMAGLSGRFLISPLFLLPPVIVIVAIAFKVPAIPGITLGILSAAVFGLIFQPGCTLGTILETGMNGFKPAIGVDVVDNLLETGGLMNMMFSVSLTILAMMFGGIMEATGQLEVIVSRLIRLVKGNVGLIALTEATCIVSNATMPEQYISIVVPGRMYAEEYRKRGLHPKTLSNALEGAGTVTSALVPWNTCGVYIRTTLGIGVAQYGMWAMFNWLMPIMVVVLAMFGVTIAKMSPESE
ncbi:MAG: Na+/H+ antiporter NhaC [Eubacterium sp.]|nr:Na+/H+ antiporter NhaC [Eubacterium sp.]